MKRSTTATHFCRWRKRIPSKRNIPPMLCRRRGTPRRRCFASLRWRKQTRRAQTGEQRAELSRRVAGIGVPATAAADWIVAAVRKSTWPLRQSSQSTVICSAGRLGKFDVSAESDSTGKLAVPTACWSKASTLVLSVRPVLRNPAPVPCAPCAPAYRYLAPLQTPRPAPPWVDVDRERP